MENKKVWLITGSSTGFGRELAAEALEQGYRVVVTARKPEAVADFVEKFPETALAVKLDVTKPDEVRAAIQSTVERFGRIDVVVNNAGYGLIGAVEEVTEEQFRHQFETNVFGAVDVMKAALPVFREQKSGHFLNLSSVGGFVAFPSSGYYTASKFALEAFSEAVAAESAHLGVKVTIVEPGAFRTDFNGRSLAVGENRLDDLYPSTNYFLDWLQENDGKQPGDPRKAAQVMIQVAEAENPPLRLPLGEDAILTIEAELEKVKTDIAPWRQAGVDTTFPGMKAGAIGS